MQYYKVKFEFDNFKYDIKDNILIANELYTAKEFEKLKRKFVQRYSPKKLNYFKNMFTIVNINKNDTYFCFGARFY